jgi:cytochrome c553
VTPPSRLLVIVVVLLAAGMLHGADEPTWAYVSTPPTFERPKDAATKQRVTGSVRNYTIDQIADLFAPPDWFPAEHAAMPDPVGRGRRPGVQACASCHLPNGRGVPQSATLAGLPADYITAQLSDFALGNRLPAVGNVNIDMGTIARALTPAEIGAAASYFSRLRPKPWITVTEVSMVPATQVVEADLVIPQEGSKTEPLGTRIVEVPESPAGARLLNPHIAFIAYVPMGSLRRGRNLVRTGGAAVVGGKTVSKTTECSKCHGVELHGLPAKPDGTPLAPSLVGRAPSYTVRQLYDIQQGARKGAKISDMKNVVAQLTTTDMIDIAAYLASRMP